MTEQVHTQDIAAGACAAIGTGRHVEFLAGEIIWEMPAGSNGVGYYRHGASRYHPEG